LKEKQNQEESLKIDTDELLTTMNGQEQSSKDESKDNSKKSSHSTNQPPSINVLSLETIKKQAKGFDFEPMTIPLQVPDETDNTFTYRNEAENIIREIEKQHNEEILGKAHQNLNDQERQATTSKIRHDRLKWRGWSHSAHFFNAA